MIRYFLFEFISTLLPSYSLKTNSWLKAIIKTVKTELKTALIKVRKKPVKVNTSR